MFDVGDYKYCCKDDSLLDPYIRRFVAAPIHRLIPIQVPANIISIFGHFCVWIVFFLSIKLPSKSACLLGMVFLQFYMVLDILDGMQARLTHTSSPLGEFIDHGGDAFNCGFIIYASLYFLNVQQSWFILVMITIGTLIFSLVSLEKKTTGSCDFPKIGNIELQCFLFVLLASMQIQAFNHMFSRVFGGLSVASWLLFSLSLVGAGMSIKTSLRRILYWPKEYLFFCFLSSILAAELIWKSIPCLEAALILIFFMATYNCELLFSHLSKKSIPWPDQISAIMIGLFCVIGLWQNVFGEILLLYLFGRAIFVCVTILRYFNPFWLWVNPLPKIIG